MKVCALTSGSKGNSTYISSGKTELLIDIGSTSLYVEKKLKEINVDPSNITGILISHTHNDHISGLKVFIKKYNPTIFATEKMIEELKKLFYIDNYVIIDDDFYIGDIKVTSIKTSHDAIDSNGYILEHNNKSVVYITDTGYINRKHYSKLKNKNLYIFESNYDVDMLMNGKYPYYLKQRILSDKGHLSNKDASYYLAKLIDEDTKTIILAHLSQENNSPEIAEEELVSKLKSENKKINRIIVSKQLERTEMVEV